MCLDFDEKIKLKNNPKITWGKKCIGEIDFLVTYQ